MDRAGGRHRTPTAAPARVPHPSAGASSGGPRSAAVLGLIAGRNNPRYADFALHSPESFEAKM
ncbi:hypothetical protein [Oryza sativa Japonica Group]|uniref:Uncharacterized protein n=2 Tax=Oryza sativa subsp. japonica TaxID=39947 RepID=Q5NB53_ORYSJ|nr:hypothetical protein [Oryza sativa Japonica Group]BAD81456.1 hypothetical protein [Oryza sativa Japonica Group]